MKAVILAAGQGTADHPPREIAIRSLQAEHPLHSKPGIRGNQQHLFFMAGARLVAWRQFCLP